MNVAAGACRRVASSRLSVPLALTVKSACGSEAAQSCEGWRGGVDHELDRAGRRANTRVDAVGVADVDLERAEGVAETRAAARGGVSRRRRRPEELGPQVVLEPDHVVASLGEVPYGLRADQPARAGDDDGTHGARLARRRGWRLEAADVGALRLEAGAHDRCPAASVARQRLDNAAGLLVPAPHEDGRAGARDRGAQGADLGTGGPGQAARPSGDTDEPGTAGAAGRPGRRRSAPSRPC